MPIAKHTTVTCPRCAVSVSTEYRFCPECAFRLVSGEESKEIAPAPSSMLPHILLLLGALALIGGFVLAGIALFQPADDLAVVEPPSRRPEVRGNILTVADIPSSLVLHEQGWSEWRQVRPEDLPGFGEAAGQWLQVFVADMKMSRYEVSRGQWREFVEDLDRQGADTAFQFVWKRLFRPLEAFEDDLASADALLTADLHPSSGFVGDAVMAAADQLRQRINWATFYVAKARQYLASWWAAVAERHEERDGRRVTRPDDLTLPIADSYIVWLLTPPSWVRLDDDGGLRRVLDDADANLPVTEISLPDALAFAAWASDKLSSGDDTGPRHKLRVPTRAEFMRAYHDEDFPEDESGRRWPWGYELDRGLCNSATLWAQREGNPTPQPYLVTQELGNRHTWMGNTRRGLVHMAGNVREWVNPQQPRLPNLEEIKKAGGKPWFYVTTKWDWDAAGTMGGSYLLGIEDCDFQSNITENPLHRPIDVGFRLVETIESK